jgi:UDP-N-acetylglucosamine 1-carboxyvinyltransferase
MECFLVEGPCRLVGKVKISGAKNAALPSLAASLLAGDTLRLHNLPRVRDIRTMCRLLEHLGIRFEQRENEVFLTPEDEGRPDDAPYDLVKQMRASALVLGPLLARRGHARVSLPGGCAIGVRPIDQHLAGLEALGAEVRLEHGYVEARASQLVGTRFQFSSPTVGGTENIMMAATLAKGTTVLENCAQEPEIRDLGILLNAMGAQIEGAGEATITIQGVRSLHGADHRIIPDRIEAGTYLIAGAITGGDVSVEGVVPADLAPLTEKLVEIGARLEISGDTIQIERPGELRARSIVTAPHPGFPTDLQAQYLALMTQVHGTSTICETVFENRFQHVPELMRMGARIEIDGRVARVHGPALLSAATVMATDLRASACLVLASLAAAGRSRIDRIYHLDRGYETMELKLQALGAHVERVATPREEDQESSSTSTDS